MKTHRDSWRARLCHGFVLSFCLLVGSARALAQVPPPPQEAPAPAISSGLPTAPIGRMRLSFSVVPAPVGSYETRIGGFDVSGDMAVAFGLRSAFDYSINDYFFVGVSPQFLLNVKGDQAGKSGQELDLLVRVGGHAPIADTLHLYGYVAPGYSIVYAPNTDDPTGFVLGVAGGAIYSFSNKLFAVADIGYQFGFQEMTELGLDLDAHISFLLIGLGVGMKL